MKNERGISVLALAITVIVILIITSITVYNGLGVLEDVRKKEAYDKLAAIGNSLRKDNTFLDFENGDTILEETDYISLDLKGYYDEDKPVKLTKTLIVGEDVISTYYKLEMYADESMTEVYETVEFNSDKAIEKNVYVPSFDERKGVNRPILYDNMYALDNMGSSLVSNVFEDSWYSYNPSFSSFAKMKYDEDGDGDITDESVVYVWIPRYAYMIQDYYNGLNNVTRPFTEVPRSAIKIVFLRENTDFMTNNEMLPAGYKVHPAFESNNIKKSGIWVAMNPSENEGTFTNAISAANSVFNTNTEDRDKLSAHLMTNSEFAAAFYLMYSYNCLNQINFSTENEFVAAGTENNSTVRNLEYSDVYEIDNSSVTGIVNKFGDALAETNWDRYVAGSDYEAAYSSLFPSGQDIVIRLLKTGYFNFDSVTSGNYHYRTVIVTK